MKTWFRIQAAADGKPAEVFLYEDIGVWGVSAQQFIDAVRALGDIPIVVRINSLGGDAFAGIAMYSYLSGRKARVDVIVDSVAASAASIVAMAGKEIRIAESGFIMIHNPLTMALGDGEDMRKAAELLDSLRDAYAKAYARRSGKTLEECKAWMAADTWFDADAAVANGFANRIEEGLKAAACADASRYSNAPKALISGATASANNNQPKEEMKTLLKALAERKLIASADVTEEVAVLQLDAAHSALVAASTDSKAKADKAADELKAANEKLAAQAKANAEAVVAQAVADKRIKDDAAMRTKWVDALVRDFDGTKAMLDSMTPAAAAPVKPNAGAPPVNIAKETKSELTGLDRVVAAFKAGKS
jgi:ATP-dependent Clp protease protease subunit